VLAANFKSQLDKSWLFCAHLKSTACYEPRFSCKVVSVRLLALYSLQIRQLHIPPIYTLCAGASHALTHKSQLANTAHHNIVMHFYPQVKLLLLHFCDFFMCTPLTTRIHSVRSVFSLHFYLISTYDYCTFD
jgi:hypothetical protein